MLRRACFLSLPALALALGLATPPHPAQAAEERPLRIGVEGAYPPFSEVGPDGQLRGFEIDLARHLCAHMKRRCELVKTDFDGLIPALKARKIDAILAAMAVTAERQKAIAFSTPYAASPAVFVGRSGTDVSAAGLQGKVIGVQSGTTFERYARDQFPASTLRRYSSQDAIYLDLQAGRLDATLVDKFAVPSALAALNAKASPAARLGMLGGDINAPSYFGAGIAVGLRPADATTLGQALNQALAASFASGEHARLAKLHFGYDVRPAGMR